MVSKSLSILLLLAIGMLAACQRAAAPVSISQKPVSAIDPRQPNVPTKPLEEMSWTGTDGTEQTVGDLQELEIEFLFSTKHRVCCAKHRKKHEPDKEFERFT